MKAKDYKYREFSSDTKAIRDEDGTWKVTIDNKERASLDGENWIEERIEVMVMDDDFDNAHKIALQSLFRWIEENVNSKGFNSMIDAAEYYRSLKEEEDGKETNDNSHTELGTNGSETEGS